jgi:beta-xylosidase
MTERSPRPDAAWTDPDRDPGERVAELMARMSLREKLAQLVGVWVGADRLRGEVAPQQHEYTGSPADWNELIRHGIGQLTRPFGTAPVEPLFGARGVAETQRAILAAGRWRIPALVHEECLTGLAAWRTAVFPSPLCWGAGFDPDLVERMAAHIGTTMRRLGIHQGLAPVLDVARDLRWGRVEETIGEDPYLVGTIGAAYVRGLQSAGRVATLKHFIGYSASRSGRNLGPVSAGPREVADVLLPPFEMALAAGARSVMNSYADIDGVPVAADPNLLTGLLRDRLGFTGTVVADYFSVAFLGSLHGVAASPADSARLALEAGIDVELPSVDCFGEPLARAVHDGRVDAALVDRAVERVLRQKCELGLLDHDWSPDPPVLAEDGPILLDDPEARAIARDLARRSIVLLHNTGALPLAPGARVAVVGPRADTAEAMMGCYSFPMHVGVHHPNVPLGLAVPSVLEALRADPAGYEVDYAPGCPVLGGDDAGIAAAARTAAGADVCVAVLGDSAGLFGVGTSGEGNDVADLRLPGRQAELLDALVATGIPVVLVLLVGRPYELSTQVDRLAAAVCGFFPGEEGATALADVLSGRIDPSGRLPIGFPRRGAAHPTGYLGPTLAQRNDVSEVDPSPLFPFGHGLSYAPPCWQSVVGSDRPWSTDGRYTVSVTLHNASSRAVSEVVQVYLHDPVAEVARPVQVLVGAPRVDLAPGARRTVHIAVHADQTSYTGRDLFRRVDPGPVELWVGASSGDIRARLPVTLVGAPRRVGHDRVMHPDVVLDPA